jgi:hypothetical protein
LRRVIEILEGKSLRCLSYGCNDSETPGEGKSFTTTITEYRADFRPPFEPWTGPVPVGDLPSEFRIDGTLTPPPYDSLESFSLLFPVFVVTMLCKLLLAIYFTGGE